MGFYMMLLSCSNESMIKTTYIITPTQKIDFQILLLCFSIKPPQFLDFWCFAAHLQMLQLKKKVIILNFIRLKTWKHHPFNSISDTPIWNPAYFIRHWRRLIGKVYHLLRYLHLKLTTSLLHSFLYTEDAKRRKQLTR